MTNATEPRHNVESNPDVYFRFHYGSIVGMTEYYRPPYARKKQERKSLISFADEDDTIIYDPDSPTKSLSCPGFSVHMDQVEEFSVDENSDDDDDGDSRESLDPMELFDSDEENAMQVDTHDREEKNCRGPGTMNWESSTTLQDLWSSNNAIHKRFNDGYSNVTDFLAENSENVREVSVLIERNTHQVSKPNDTLARDSHQLSKTKNMVKSKIAMFESLQKKNEDYTRSAPRPLGRNNRPLGNNNRGRPGWAV